jgi:hypothetical protein
MTEKETPEETETIFPIMVYKKGEMEEGDYPGTPLGEGLICATDDDLQEALNDGYYLADELLKPKKKKKS